MTEQEVEALAKKLTRIWQVQSIGVNGEYPLTQWHLHKGEVTFKSSIADDVDFFMAVFERRYVLVLGRKRGTVITGSLSYDAHTGAFGGRELVEAELQKEFDQFADEWLPFFRRGCWLSGCPIEASAHEKVEWMQGFSREELQAWNLKM